MGSNITAAELSALIAAAVLAVYWWRGGRAWMLPVGVGHIFIAIVYLYLTFNPVGEALQRAQQAGLLALIVPLGMTAANAFLFGGLLQLLGRAPPLRYAAVWVAVGTAVAFAHVVGAPTVAIGLAVAATLVGAPIVGVLMIREGTLFYVIVGALFLERALFQLAAAYFTLVHPLPHVVEILIYVNLLALVGDGFGLILIEYDDTRWQLAQADRAKVTFLASISHELRTPLNAVIGFAELIVRHTAANDKHQRYAADILSAGRNLLGVVNQVLEIVDIDAKRLRLDIQPLDVADIVGAVVHNLKAKAEEKGIETRLDVAPGGVDAMADGRALTQVVSCLVDNAIKFSNPGGHVDLSLGPAPQHMVSLTVADHGIGMSPERLRDLFKPFAPTGEVYTRSHPGLGLGLVVVKKLIDAMSGQVMVKSAVGRGSRFTVLLPAVA